MWRSRARCGSNIGLAVLLMSGYFDFIADAAQLQLDILNKPCSAATLASAIRASVARVRAART